MNERYRSLLHYLNEAALNIDDFISGKMILFEDIPIKKDCIYEKLTECSVLDCLVSVILSVMLPVFAKLMQYQYKEHLPGGKYTNLDENKTKSVDMHNKYP